MGHTAATGKARRAPEKLSPLSPAQTSPRPIMVGSPGGGGDGELEDLQIFLKQSRPVKI